MSNGLEMAMTLEEVAEHFGLTRERIRQIEAKALKKFRRGLAALQEREAREAREKRRRFLNGR